MANRHQEMGANRTLDTYFPTCLLEHAVLVPAASGWPTVWVLSVSIESNW